MNLKYLLCILLILIPGGFSFSQENVYTNINLIDNFIEESFAPLNNKLLLLGKDNFYEIQIDDRSEQGAYLLSSVKRNFPDYKFIINENTDSAVYKISISKPEFRIRYREIFTDDILGTKKVKREVSASYDTKLTDKKTSDVIFNQNFTRKISDNFELDKLGFVEDTRYTFTRAKLPEENTFNQIIIPSLIITVSAAAIILFFIIRSK